MQLFTEKLELNKQSKSVPKNINELKEGDVFYIYHYFNDKHKVIKCITKQYIEYQLKFFPDEIQKRLEYIYKNTDHFMRFWNDENTDSAIVYLSESQIYISTDYDLLKKIIDDQIDDEIRPIQAKIDKLQQEINDKLKLKEKDYLQDEE